MFGVDTFNYGAIFNAEEPAKNKKRFKTENDDLLEGYGALNTTLQEILNGNCGGDEGRSKSNNCSTGPFTRFNVRGEKGDSFDDAKWRFASPNKLELYNHDGDEWSGGAWIKMRSGYIADFTIHVQTEGENSFNEEWLKIDTQSIGVIESGTGNTMSNADGKQDSWIRVLMFGDKGDELQVDIDGEWSGISRFKLKVNGENLINENTKSIDDEVFIILNDVYEEGGGGSNCSNLNRVESTTGVGCGDCDEGYILDEDESSDTYGECVESGNNVLLYAGIGGAALLILFATMK